MGTEPAIPSAEVLNGTVYKGSTIAYATRSGSSMDMNIATVLEIWEKPHSWKDEMTKILKVEVSKSTDMPSLPRVATIGVLNRVVKLSD